MKPVNGSGQKRAVIINDISCFGKCSLTVAIPILSAYGVEAVPLPTAVLSTHTGEFENYFMHDLTDEMKSITAHWKSLGLKFDCIYTGFFCSAEQIRLTQQFIKDFAEENTLIIVDPVLGDNGKLYPCFDDEYAAELRNLAKMADIITPNHTEAALLCESDCGESDEKIIRRLSNRGVVITSARRNDKIGFLSRFGEKTVRIERDTLDVMLHGAGDVFSSALCGELLSGKSEEQAVKNAADFCNRCIADTLKRGQAHWYGLSFEDEIGKNFSI